MHECVCMSEGVRVGMCVSIVKSGAVESFIINATTSKILVELSYNNRYIILLIVNCYCY